MVGFLFPLCCFAQKKQLQVVKEQVKAGKELDKAEKTLQGLLDDSIYRKENRIWLLLCDVLIKQYELGNEKLYLKQQYDTTAFFSITRKLYNTMSRFDTLDACSNSIGRIQPKYRLKHSIFLNSIRPNLFNGGSFFIHKNDYQTAFNFFSDYLCSAKWPLFEKYDYIEKDALMPHAAYWAMYCGYKLGDADKIMLFKDIAERDTSMLNFVRQYEAEAYLLKKDTTMYVKSLQVGFEQYPNFAFFFPRLAEYYVKMGQYGKALDLSERALKADSTSLLFKFAKSTALLNLGRYVESIQLCLKIIKENASFSDAYYNIGLAYFNQAIELNKDRQKYRANKEKIITLYQRSKPYMEKFRELAPTAKSKWLAPLYTIYLNLNMGKEFDEIDKLRKEKY